MIEVVRARSGAPVIKMDGRFLASRTDPVREGNRWAERVLEQMPRDALAIVLGLGSVHGPAALQKLMGKSRVIVLEPHSLLVERAKQLALTTYEPLLNNFDFQNVITAQSPDDILKNTRFLAAWEKLYHPIIHGAGADSNPEWHTKAYQLLLSRDAIWLQRTFSFRQDTKEIVDPNLIHELTGLVSARDIAACLKPEADGPAAGIWRCLAELIV